MSRFLGILGVPDQCYELIDVVIRSCPHCLAFQPVPRRLRYGAELAGHFGDILVIDIFFLFEKMFLLWIDEATRYKIAETQMMLLELQLVLLELLQLLPLTNPP